MSTAFFYGTLMFAEVRRALLGRSPRTVPAILSGYRRCVVRLPRRVELPVIQEQADAQVAGLLAVGLQRADLARLDQFENVGGGLYRRIVCSVETDTGKRSTYAYVAGSRLAGVDGPHWDPDRFEQRELKRFLRQVFAGPHPPWVR